MRTIVIISFLYVLPMAPFALADDWSQFRGNDGQGLSIERAFPTRWSPTQRVLWASKIPGRGNSSPAVTQSRIDITTQIKDDSYWILSLDRKSGQHLRETKVGVGKLAATGSVTLYGHRHNVASPSPVSSGSHIWAFFGSGEFICQEAKTGKEKWRKDLVEIFGDYEISFGMASSPRLWNDRLIVACMTKSVSYVLALHKLTGDVLWKTNRTISAKHDAPDGYSSPTISMYQKKPVVLVVGADHVNAYDLDSGMEVWRRNGLNINSPYGRIIASPIARNGIVVACSANPAGGGLGHVAAWRMNAVGEERPKPLWRFAKSTPDSSTPVCVNNMVFMVSEQGIATCTDLITGQVHWQRRLAKGPYYASVVSGGGNVYFLSSTGICTVVKVSEKFEIIAKNSLVGTFFATPALSDGQIILRSHSRIYTIQ